MELLLVWAYVSYYARGWRALKGFLQVLVRNTRALRRFRGKTN
jgi:hypothetical protein